MAGDNTAAGVTVNGKPVDISSYFHRLTDDVGFGGISFSNNANMMDGGAYYNKVLDRLMKADDPLAEARNLNDMFKANLDIEHNAVFAQRVELLEGKFYAKLEDDLNAAAKAAKAKTDKKDDQQQKTDLENANGKPVKPMTREDAIRNFALQYTSAVKNIIDEIQNNEEQFVTMRTYETVEKPSSFANAVMTTLMDQLDAMMDTTFASVKGDLIKDILSIGGKELNLNYWSMFTDQEGVITKIKEDSFKMAGDNSYQVDIGV